MRPSDRQPNELQSVSIETGYKKNAEGSVLTCAGQTVVCCAASVNEMVPPFLRKSGLVVVQGSAEGTVSSQVEFLEMLRLAKKGCAELVEAQKAALG